MRLTTSQKAQAVLEQQGYIVMAFLPGPKPPPAVGNVLPGPIDGVPGPFYVMATATEADYRAQRFGRKHRASIASQAIAFFKLVAE